VDPIEVIKEERKFLHDVSNHLLVAQGMGSFIDNVIAGQFDEDSKEAQRSKKVMNAINKIIELVKERRDNLHAVSKD
tara:strand:+ start:490193 stop:490423 length:231 start_codon:yes stop_codon:yes gene_type:complete